MKTEISNGSRRASLGAPIGLPLMPATILPLRAGERAGVRCPAPPFSRPSPNFDLQSPDEGQALVIPIAGFRYYDGHEALPDLRAGTPLTLRAEPDNPHDAFAVEILHDRTKLGYVPRFCNRHLSRLLQRDVSLTCEVANVRTDVPPWDAVAVRLSLNHPELQAE